MNSNPIPMPARLHNANWTSNLSQSGLTTSELKNRITGDTSTPGKMQVQMKRG